MACVLELSLRLPTWGVVSETHPYPYHRMPYMAPSGSGSLTQSHFLGSLWAINDIAFLNRSRRGTTWTINRLDTRTQKLKIIIKKAKHTLENTHTSPENTLILAITGNSVVHFKRETLGASFRILLLLVGCFQYYYACSIFVGNIGTLLWRTWPFPERTGNKSLNLPLQWFYQIISLLARVPTI